MIINLNNNDKSYFKMKKYIKMYIIIMNEFKLK